MSDVVIKKLNNVSGLSPPEGTGASKLSVLQDDALVIIDDLPNFIGGFINLR